MPSIHRVWIRAVSHAGVGLIPGVYVKASMELAKVQSHSLECWGVCECDFLSRLLSLFQRLPGKKSKIKQKQKPIWQSWKHTDCHKAKELLGCNCLPVRYCWESHSLSVTANYVNSSNMDGPRNHWSIPHRNCRVIAKARDNWANRPDPTLAFVNGWRVFCDSWDLESRQGKQNSRGNCRREMMFLYHIGRALGEQHTLRLCTSLEKQCCD